MAAQLLDGLRLLPRVVITEHQSLLHAVQTALFVFLFLPYTWIKPSSSCRLVFILLHTYISSLLVYGQQDLHGYNTLTFFSTLSSLTNCRNGYLKMGTVISFSWKNLSSTCVDIIHNLANKSNQLVLYPYTIKCLILSPTNSQDLF